MALQIAIIQRLPSLRKTGARGRGGGHELKNLGLLSALRSANLYVRAKLNRGAVSLGTDASRRAKELRSRVRRSNAVVEAGNDTFGSVTGDHTGSHGSSFLLQKRSAPASSCLFLPLSHRARGNDLW